MSLAVFRSKNRMYVYMIRCLFLIAEVTMSAVSEQRFFVGNLFPEVKDTDLSHLFSDYGSDVVSEIKHKQDIDGNVKQTFAFVTVKGDRAVVPASTVIQKLNGLKWKKHAIRVQVAQESFMQRLARERREREEKAKNFSTEHHPSYDPMALVKKRVDGGDSDEVVKKQQDSDPLRPPTVEISANQQKRISTRDKFAYEKMSKFKARYEADEPDLAGEADGTAADGVIDFSDNVGTGQKRFSAKKRAYHSSSEDDDADDAGSKAHRVPLLPKARPKVASASSATARLPQRRRYYSSSSDDDNDDARKSAGTKSNVMTKLESFNSGFWRDSDGGGDANDSKVRDAANDKRLESVRQRQRELLRPKTSKMTINPERSGKAKRFDDAKLPEKMSSSAGKLFEDSDSEDDEDGDRFKIRPQFEGKKGEKLLALQSRFASNDERFKIDTRFGEDNGEEEMEEDMDAESERNRNLRILQSVVGGTKSEAASETSRKSRPVSHFKDASKLRFDPAREEEFKLKEDDGDSSE